MGDRLEYLFFVLHHWLQTYSMCLTFRIRKYLNLIYAFDPGFTDLFVWIKMLLDKNYEKHEWKMKSHLNIKWCLEYYIGFPVLLSFLQRFHWWARVWSTFYCLLASRKRLYIKIAICLFKVHAFLRAQYLYLVPRIARILNFDRVFLVESKRCFMHV